MPAATPSDGSPANAGEALRRARVYLARVAEPPAASLTAFVDVHGPVEAAARVRAGDVPDAVRAETDARHGQDLVDQDLEAAAHVGARLVVPEDDDWPTWRMLCLSAAATRGMDWAAPPLALWVRGPARLADAFDQASVSVVGARSATGYGEFVAAETGFHLARADTTVVSGASYGIDGAAHRGALAAEGLTVAVLACGVDLPYPRGHATLIDRIAESGLIVSEYPPGTVPAQHRFTVRNRLIAALSNGTVVVEAGKRSGALNVARTAAAFGKVVLAVPGPITSAASAGCHELMRAGTAFPVASVDQIRESFTDVHKGPTPRQ